MALHCTASPIHRYRASNSSQQTPSDTILNLYLQINPPATHSPIGETWFRAINLVQHHLPLMIDPVPPLPKSIASYIPNV